jgi:hypothetical protein
VRDDVDPEFQDDEHEERRRGLAERQHREPSQDYDDVQDNDTPVRPCTPVNAP